MLSETLMVMSMKGYTLIDGATRIYYDQAQYRWVTIQNGRPAELSLNQEMQLTQASISVDHDTKTLMLS